MAARPPPVAKHHCDPSRWAEIARRATTISRCGGTAANLLSAPPIGPGGRAVSGLNGHPRLRHARAANEVRLRRARRGRSCVECRAPCPGSAPPTFVPESALLSDMAGLHKLPQSTTVRRVPHASAEVDVDSLFAMRRRRRQARDIRLCDALRPFVAVFATATPRHEAACWMCGRLHRPHRLSLLHSFSRQQIIIHSTLSSDKDSISQAALVAVK
ncbi:hypothetical protein BS50DRAFT_663601 [Corynespora cassiicola Philippines]|uniref:Uncharacterized protein n=1 Tax=Corynespora cassiicola Philippines TaxID=1448308 RepID=A0A2T2NTW8_CORCC|nr:hypothetical protein BS50DRAFT_663601 [Corynespora cassiicola Philippines]